MPHALQAQTRSSCALRRKNAIRPMVRLMMTDECGDVFAFKLGAAEVGGELVRSAGDRHHAPP